jgi:hypothetical protein
MWLIRRRKRVRHGNSATDGRQITTPESSETEAIPDRYRNDSMSLPMRNAVGEMHALAHEGENRHMGRPLSENLAHMPFELEFEETFGGDALDPSRWLPCYLPHWSTRERSAARYVVGGGRLRLLIETDQPPWCPELDGQTRVSSLQTGAFAGPLGSGVGQHRFNREAVVREAQPNLRLYTPKYGRIELRAKASDDPDTMVALWMIGYEDEPERSAELCVCEIFGRDVGEDQAVVGVGVHPFGDPLIRDVFSREAIPIDAREFHVYAADWTPDQVAFSVDGELVKTVDQSPAYPMQLMLGIYEFPPAGGDDRTRPYPKMFVVDYVRGYRLTADAVPAP